MTFANFADVLQYSLQASLVDDTLLAVEYARAEIAPALAPADPPEMVVGHSMGGRLSYFTASEAGIGNTMTMSPYPQLEGKFDPAVVLAGGGFAGKRTLCLNGALDCIASPEKRAPRNERAHGVTGRAGACIVVLRFEIGGVGSNVVQERWFGISFERTPQTKMNSATTVHDAEGPLS